MNDMLQSFSHGYAVVVGVGADLPVTIEDAKAISSTLLDPTRCAYPEHQVRLLTGESARRDHIVSSLKWLAQSASEDDTAIVYFSGHGTENPGFYLVPFGFEWQNLENTAISGTEFTELLRSIKARKLLVLLDCCHAGGQAEAKGFVKSPISSAALDELGRSSGRVVIASSRKDEVSWTGNPYSQFTMAVLEALSGQGAFEQDGFARVLDLGTHVTRVVPERTGDKQHPILKVHNLEDNYALAWYAGGEKMPKKLSWMLGSSESSTVFEITQINAKRSMLGNYRENLLLIEERISEYIIFTDIPLQLIKSKQYIAKQIKELELQLHQV
jgi:hypothetical protein